MSTISDISSITTYNSMPPLIDRFGRIVLDEDGESTIADEAVPLNTHLYFDEHGNEISYEEYRQRITEEVQWGGTGDFEEPEEDEEPPWIRTPLIDQRFVLKHPRVILAFLRFVDLYNELADPEEVLMLKAIPQNIVSLICNHPSVADVPPEFQEDVEELRFRLEAHQDLSELQWSQEPPTKETPP